MFTTVFMIAVAWSHSLAHVPIEYKTLEQCNAAAVDYQKNWQSTSFISTNPYFVKCHELKKPK